jgi:hypothetical protein
MWSETNPIGTSTTDSTASTTSSSRWSFTSGSSQGTCGGPDREQNTRSWACERPVTSATRAATYDVASRCWARYAPPIGPLPAFMVSGIEWVTKTRRACGLVAVAATTASTTGSRNPGWLK